MTVEVLGYGPEHRALVREFNGRLAAGGSRWSFYEDDLPDWVPRDPAASIPVWREYFVALEDGATVRGAYCLKPQEFLLGGRPVQLASWQGPVSEGDVDRRFAFLALQLLRDMERRAPLLFGWGATRRMSELLERLHWRSYETPFLLHVVHPFAFLRRNALLRGSRRNRLVLDAAAWTGLGAVGIGFLQAAARLRAASRGAGEPVVEPRFGAWADEVWERARGDYALVAVRTSEALNALMPADGWPETTILRVAGGGGTLGWAAVRDSRMAGDVRFGSLRVGSIVDAFGPPEAAGAITSAARRFLERRGVDLVVANFSHPAWVDGFRSAGFVALPNRRRFTVSPSFARAYPDLDELVRGMHLTPIDGDGPRGL